MVKWITGARWIADFRDPWMTSGGKGLFSTCAASLAIERWMERTVTEAEWGSGSLDFDFNG